MSASPAPASLTTKGRAAKRGRFVVAPSTRVQIGDPASPEFVGVGSIPNKEDSAAVVYEHGAAQTGIPVYAIGSTLASGKVFAPAAVIECFHEEGTLDALRKALAQHDAAIAKQAANAAK